MKRSVWMAAALVGGLLAGPGRAEEPPVICGPAPEHVACCGIKERAAAEDKAAPGWHERRQRPIRPWPDYNRRITWQESFDAGQREAVAKRRMLLAMQVVGNLKDEGC